jgi:Na+/H+ antiporter NhaD/arsenite permease-like protein
MAVAIGTFVVALGIIVSDKVHRTKIALAGAVLIVASQTIDQRTAIESIDFNTLGRSRA